MRSSAPISARAHEGSPRATSARLAVGDPLRALAALGVFGVHAVGSSVESSGYAAEVGGTDHFAALFGALGHAFNSLGAGVSVFFVLSAYLLSRPFLRTYIENEPLPSIPAYLRNRGLRVVPAFWVVLALAFVFHGTRGDSFGESLGLFGFISSFKSSGMHDVFGQPWSLNVEVRVYLLLPLAALLLIALKRVLGTRLPRAARIVLVLALIGLGFEASIDYAPQDAPLYDSFAANASHFAPGLVLAVLEHVLPRHVKSARWISLAAPAMFVVGLGMAVFSQYLVVEGPPSLARYVLPVGTGLILAGPLLWQWRGAAPWRALDNRVLRWIGERSYSLFLVHSLVVAGLAPHLALGGYKSTLIVLGSASLAGSLLAAAVLYRFVELPALRLKDRAQRTGTARVAGRSLDESKGLPDAV